MLTFKEVSEINAARCKVWHAEMDEWVISDWTNAMTGEAGEAANYAKKIRRWETGQPGSVDAPIADLMMGLALELGDTFFYLDLAFTKMLEYCEYYKITPPFKTLDEALIYKFNSVSDREAVTTQPSLISSYSFR